jgi:hypothetical protein
VNGLLHIFFHLFQIHIKSNLAWSWLLLQRIKKTHILLLKLIHAQTITMCVWSLQLWFTVNPKSQIYNSLSNWTLIDDILFQSNHVYSLQLLPTVLNKKYF